MGVPQSPIPNERDSNKTVSIFILKTIYFILQNMF